MKRKFEAEITIQPDGEMVIKNLSAELLDLASTLNPEDRILRKKKDIKVKVERGRENGTKRRDRNSGW